MQIRVNDTERAYTIGSRGKRLSTDRSLTQVSFLQRFPLSMFRAPRFLVLLVLAVWFSATQHCELAGFGLASPCAVSGESGLPCTKDGCDQVEHASYQAQTHAVKAPAPAVILIDPFASEIVLAFVPVQRSVDVSPAVVERPRNWVATWHFVRRAAPPSRAPALLCA